MTKRLGNRIVSFVLAALLLLTSVPMQAFAEGEAGTETAAVDWENVIDDCELELVEGTDRTDGGYGVEHIRDGSIEKQFVGGGEASATIKFTFPSEKNVKKIICHVQSFTGHTHKLGSINIITSDPRSQS